LRVGTDQADAVDAALAHLQLITIISPLGCHRGEQSMMIFFVSNEQLSDTCCWARSVLLKTV